MGTNCFYVFKYNKKYYIYFKGNDSYPSGLGKIIVNELQQMSAEDMIEIKNLINSINVNTTYDNSYCGFKNLVHSLQNPKKYAFQIKETEPELEIGIQYIYIIDMDKNVFLVKFYGTRHEHIFGFDINNIPLQWEKLIEDYYE